MWVFPSFAPPAAERFSAVPRSKSGPTNFSKKRSGAGGAKLGNTHIQPVRTMAVPSLQTAPASTAPRPTLVAFGPDFHPPPAPVVRT